MKTVGRVETVVGDRLVEHGHGELGHQGVLRPDGLLGNRLQHGEIGLLRIDAEAEGHLVDNLAVAARSPELIASSRARFKRANCPAGDFSPLAAPRSLSTMSSFSSLVRAFFNWSPKTCSTSRGGLVPRLFVRQRGAVRGLGGFRRFGRGGRPPARPLAQRRLGLRGGCRRGASPPAAPTSWTPTSRRRGGVDLLVRVREGNHHRRILPVADQLALELQRADQVRVAVVQDRAVAGHGQGRRLARRHGHFQLVMLLDRHQAVGRLRAEVVFDVHRGGDDHHDRRLSAAGSRRRGAAGTASLPGRATWQGGADPGGPRQNPAARRPLAIRLQTSSSCDARAKSLPGGSRAGARSPQGTAVRAPTAAKSPTHRRPRREDRSRLCPKPHCSGRSGGRRAGLARFDFSQVPLNNRR